MSTRTIQQLLPKLAHFDADERYMATRDLIKELTQIKTLDQSLQVPIRKAILTQLDDKGADVSTIAVKALETIVVKFNADQIVIMITTLGKSLVDKSQSESRDIYSEALKTILANCDEDTGKKIAPDLLKNLMIGLSGKSTADEEASGELASMAVLVALLEGFGAECTKSLGDILDYLLKLLGHPYESARMQASQTIGHITPYVEAASFKNLMNVMISQIESAQNPAVYIQCIVVISKFAALRVAAYLSQLIPILLKYCNQECDNLDQTTDLWSNCLAAFNSLIQRCPNKMENYLEEIVKRSQQLMSFDPNMADDSPAEGQDADMDGEEDEDWGDDGGEDWGDDGGDDGGDGGEAWGQDDEVPDASADESWKIRKAAIAVLSVFITNRSDILNPYVDELANKLIRRFNERDSSVQEQVFQTFGELLREASNDSFGDKGATDEDDLPPMGPMSIPTLTRQRSFFDTIVEKIPLAIDSISPVFSKTTINGQKAIYGVLAEISKSLEDRMGEYFASLMPHILYGLTASGKAAILNEDAINLTLQIFRFNSFEELQPYIEKIANASIKLVQQAMILVKPRGLLLCGMVAGAIEGHCTEEKSLEGVVENLYQAAFAQLKEKATNESIKIASITSMALILASNGDIIGKSSCTSSLGVIKKRLDNSVTSVAALKAITKIANSKVQVDLSLIVTSSVPKLSSFLRQVSSELKQEAMICMDALVRTHGNKISGKDYQNILTEVENHIGEQDLQLAGQGLTLMSSILANSKNGVVSSQIAKQIIPKTMKFVQSELLHGKALEALVKFFQSCVEYGGKEKSLSFVSLLSSLRACVNSKLARPGYSSVAQCIAGITIKTTDKLKTETVKHFLVEFSSKKTSEQNKQIALLSIGELGHELNLSSYGNVFKEILSAFESEKVGVREAASFALGNVTVGSMKSFMPKLFEMISSQGSNEEYLLLCSLKENIISHQKKVDVFKEYVPKTMQLLCERAESEDEGIRKVTAECLGRLGVIDMSVVIPKLEEISKNEKPKIRAVAATALRFSLQGAYVSEGIGNQIGQCIESFLNMLKDKDLGVQREAILTARTFCIVKEVVITRSHLTDYILPVLYSETKEHPDLIEEIDYGGFKVKLDQGLPLRKAVYQTLDAILDSASHLVDMGKFNDAMKVGLADADYDVQIMTYHSYEKLAKSHSEVLLQMLDDFPSLILGSIKGHLKVAKSKEPLRAVECLRVIVQAMLTFNQVKGVELCAKYTKFYKQVLRTALLKEILKDLQS